MSLLSTVNLPAASLLLGCCWQGNMVPEGHGFGENQGAVGAVVPVGPVPVDDSLNKFLVRPM